MKTHANIMWSTVWAYQWKQLVRNRLLMLSFSVLALSALYSAHYGRNFVDRQRAMIALSDSLDRYRQEKVYFHPTDFAALSIGQKDNLPFVHPKYSSRQSFYSVSATDIQNPGKLLAGNFDLSFITLYLLPLLVIVYGYGLRSEEVEQGTYTLVRVQSDATNLLRHKWLFRFTIVCMFMILLDLAAFWVAGIPLTDQWEQKASWLLSTVVYTLFWFSLVWLVVRLGTPGSLAALLLGGFWVLLLLLVPTLVYRQVSDSHGKEQARILFNQRGDFPKAKDLEPAVLIDSFARLDHPVALPSMTDTSAAMQRIYRIIRVGEVQERFDHGLGRQVLDLQAAEYRRTLAYNWVNPVYNIQHVFNQIAGTEINFYHDYLTGLDNFNLMRRYARYAHWMAARSLSTEGNTPEPYPGYTIPVMNPWQSSRLLFPVLALTLVLLSVGELRRNE